MCGSFQGAGPSTLIGEPSAEACNNSRQPLLMLCVQHVPTYLAAVWLDTHTCRAISGDQSVAQLATWALIHLIHLCTSVQLVVVSPRMAAAAVAAAADVDYHSVQLAQVTEKILSETGPMDCLETCRTVFDLPLELKDKKTTALRITLPPHFPQVGSRNCRHGPH